MARKKKDAPDAPTPFIEQTHTDTKSAFPVVGIGASAGGLEAFGAFFKAMPPTSGMAFVLVAHLDPTHISLLPELLQKHTEMPVLQVKDGMVVQPNIVHIIPPNRDLQLSNGVLYLTELKQPRGNNLPIDAFFRSLAQDQGAHAVCIILSGTGSDGTLGLKAIKGELGLVIVQDEESAGYEGMPRSAIATHLVDYVLPPHKMPEALINYMQHTRNVEQGQESSPQITSAILFNVYALLRTHTHNDFSLYKENTIIRRIERRMAVHQIVDAPVYVRYLQENEREVNILFKELLIGVTSFFRDPASFATLANLLLEALRDKPRDYNFRVWVPGCSTGEEAYSIAILLQECMQQLKSYFNVQIFATDIDDLSINTARAGFYPLSIASDVGPERLTSFFLQEGNGYHIKKNIREMLVFAPQNMIQDPPFTKLDMLSCRNVLIYFGADLQKKLLPIFHYSLKTNGILFLGSSETTSNAADLYTVKNKKAKIFTSNIQPPATYKPIGLRAVQRHVSGNSETDQDPRNKEFVSIRLVEAILQQSDTLPCVLVDTENNILYVHGHTGRFLEPAIGRINTNIVDMARNGLKGELAAAIREAHISRKKVVRTDLRVEQHMGHQRVHLTVNPLLEQTALHDLLLISFEAVEAAKRPKSKGGKSQDSNTEALELELHATKDHLQSTIEEFETTHEELKSANEELQSANEELQSTNEELETSKEELQSLNEESATVNAELQSRIDELTHAHDDMKNLLDSTQIATLFLDSDLHIKRFTPKMTEIIALTKGDIGRPIGDLASKLEDIDLSQIAQRVLDSLHSETIEVSTTEVSTANKCFFSLRVLPYRTVNNIIDGVVITLDDTTQSKKLETELQHSESLYRLVLKNADLVVAHTNRELRYSWIHSEDPNFSDSLYLGKRDDEIADSEGSRQLTQLKEQVLRTGVAANAVITLPSSEGERTYSISAEPTRDATGTTSGVTTISLAISDRQKTDKS